MASRRGRPQTLRDHHKRSVGSVASFVPRYLHEYTADLSRGLPAGDFTRPRSIASTVGVHRYPATSARLEPVYLWRGFTRWFLTFAFPSC